MREFFQRRWFLVALVALIGLGQWLGATAPSSAEGVVKLVVNPSLKAWLIAAVLFLMSVTLDSHRLRGAIAAPLPALWAVIVSAVLIPLAAPLLMPWQRNPDLAIGLLIAASVPCTLAAASVWTRRAGGNDAVSLLVTIVTNGACFLYTPFWLRQFSQGTVELDAGAMMLRLLTTALLPTVGGQICRWRANWAAQADRWKTPLGVVAQIGILFTVFAAALEAGGRLASSSNLSVATTTAPSVAALIVVAASCIGLHLAAMFVAVTGAKLARFPRADAIAVAFSGSQKTLPIGVLIATDPRMFGTEFPWAVYPMLIFHASQLFIDTAVADRFLRGGDAVAVGADSTSAPDPQSATDAGASAASRHEVDEVG